MSYLSTVVTVFKKKLDLDSFNNYSENNKKIERMTVVGECNFYTPPKEQVPKKTLGINLSGRWNHSGTQLWRAHNIYATKGEGSTKN